jgi:hypothetical protein
MVWNCKYFSLILSENLLEEGRNIWPKHVVGYTIYNAINLHILHASLGRISHNFALKFDGNFAIIIIIIIIIIVLLLWIEKLQRK